MYSFGVLYQYGEYVGYPGMTGSDVTPGFLSFPFSGDRAVSVFSFLRVSVIPEDKMADKIVPLAEKRLLDVKLGQLPNWLATCNFTPNGIFASLRRGHDRYYNKYVNVKKGGIGGIAMVLAAYIVLSYTWEYDHIKHDRWRKYH